MEMTMPENMIGKIIPPIFSVVRKDGYLHKYACTMCGLYFDKTSYFKPGDEIKCNKCFDNTSNKRRR